MRPLLQANISTALMILTVILFFLSCSDSPNDSDVGQLTVRVTDAPFPIDMVDYANVTINKVEIRSVGSDTGSPYITLTDEDFSETFDLLLLQNGVTGDVVQMEVPVGSYDLVRLYVDTTEIKVTDGDVYHLKVPSGSQTGIKVFVNPAIEVAGGLSAELLLDFDINKSFVVKGNPSTPAGINGFNFKPVIRAVNESEAGRISGYVKNTTDAPIEGATVLTEIAPEDTLFTLTDADGFYALVGLDPGTYFVTAQEAVHDTVKVENIEVVVGNNTEQDFELTTK
jgi:hypothetical protein